MVAQEKSVHKKGRGRPAGRQFCETIPVRLTVDMMKGLDAWAKRSELTRSEAIRELLKEALATNSRKTKRPVSRIG